MEVSEFYAFLSLIQGELIPALNLVRSDFHDQDFIPFDEEYPWPLDYILYARQKASIYNEIKSQFSVINKDQLNKLAGGVLQTLEKKLGAKEYYGGSRPNILDKFVFSCCHAILKGPDDCHVKKMLQENMSLMKVI